MKTSRSFRHGMSTHRRSVIQETIDNLRGQSWTDYIREAEGDATDQPAPGAEEEPDPKTAVEEAQASIDDQVNGILTDAVEEAVNLKNEGCSIRGLARRICEADDEKDDETLDVSGEPSKKTLSDIDVGSFAASVVRLIENFESLIEVRDTLVEMAKAQLRKTHDDAVIKAFTELLEEEYDISQGSTQWDKDLENQPPPAKGAGSSTG